MELQQPQKIQNYNPHPRRSGSMIAFTSEKEGNMEIFVMNIDDLNQKQLTHNPYEDGFATWAPIWK